MLATATGDALAAWGTGTYLLRITPKFRSGFAATMIARASRGGSFVGPFKKASSLLARRVVNTGSQIQDTMNDIHELLGANDAIRARILSFFGPKARLQTRAPHPNFHALFGEESSPQFSSDVVKDKLEDVLANADVSATKKALLLMIEHECLLNNELYGFDLTRNHPLDYRRWDRVQHSAARARIDLPIFRRIVTEPKITEIKWRTLSPSEEEEETCHIQEYPVTLSQFQKFVDDGGYQTKRYWSDEHWDWVASTGKSSPQSWSKIGTWASTWFLRVLPISATPDYPVCRISLAEAMAFASYQEERLTGSICGKISLPSEEQWAMAALEGSLALPLVEDGGILEHHDLSSVSSGNSFLGNAWEWTRTKSSEKDEYILRGGSVLTPRRLLLEDCSLSRPATCDMILNSFRLVCTDEIACL